MTLKKMHNDYVPENGNHPPKGAHKEPDAASAWDKEKRRQWKKAKTNPSYKDQKKDKPEQGKVYALTGKSSDASIARGDSWKKSEVKK